MDGLGTRRVGAQAEIDDLRSRLRRQLTDDGEDPRAVIRELAADVEPGLIASAGPRYFGFVIGGSLPVAVAADWLTSAWDQNGGGYVASPALSVAEEVAGQWVLELLGLPRGASVGFVTGCQMAHFTCLAAARHAVLGEVGWDVEAQGLQGAPEVRVIAGEQAHVTVGVACRMLGLGFDRVRAVATDDQGRMLPAALEEELGRSDGPTIVCAQAGEINTGAFDPLAQVVDACRRHGAWCHVDGAFGLWAAASPARRGLVEGIERADSWATDGHKWLNVPYDCGIAVVADSSAHRTAMTSDLALHPSTRGGHALGLRRDAGVLAQVARAAGLRGAALPRSPRRGRARRPLLRPRPAHGRAPLRGRRRRRAERRRPEPGGGPLRRR